MKAYNEEIAEAFEEIGDLLGIQGEGFFTIRAYREGARIMREEAYPITKKNADVAKLQELDKIGEALATKIVNLVETGKIPLLEKLRKEIPKGVRELLQIPSMGPGKVGKVYVMLGVKNKKDLIRKAKNGELEALPGFGKKSVEKILDAIEQGQEKKKRHERSEIEKFAKVILPLLKDLKGFKDLEIAGSYRRQSKTVGDMDILVTGKVDPKKAEEMIVKNFENIRILGSGETKVSFITLPDNLQVDIRFLPVESYGAALLYFTGSKDFNVKMRKIAIEKGYLLNEYGLMKQGEYIAGKTEEEVFEKLDMEYVAPKDRK